MESTYLGKRRTVMTAEELEEARLLLDMNRVAEIIAEIENLELQENMDLDPWGDPTVSPATKGLVKLLDEAEGA